MLSVASATVGSLTGVLLWLFGWRVSTDWRLTDTDRSDLHQVATSQLTVYREVKQRTIPHELYPLACRSSGARRFHRPYHFDGLADGKEGIDRHCLLSGA